MCEIFRELLFADSSEKSMLFSLKEDDWELRICNILYSVGNFSYQPSHVSSFLCHPFFCEFCEIMPIRFDFDSFLQSITISPSHTEDMPPTPINERDVLFCETTVVRTSIVIPLLTKESARSFSNQSRLKAKPNF
uniref:Uncharacterized protein n=1 Tax=uncultured marine group II/III euryarchaeote AD1000_114_C07 TaxID=1457719 RepID=A0A075FNJ6_9EURY|nr:hypothetical protein [uncultured marine group II/III euryarchaeote AD1000_114_C07]